MPKGSNAVPNSSLDVLVKMNLILCKRAASLLNKTQLSLAHPGHNQKRKTICTTMVDNSFVDISVRKREEFLNRLNALKANQVSATISPMLKFH